MPLSSIRPNPNQPRKEFDESALKDLADSIRSKGLIQPIIVRPLPPGDATDAVKYEIIAGERRWRASQLAEQTEVPVVIKPVGEATDVLLLSLIENLQREDLNPIEEATAYRRLSNYYKLTQQQIAEAVGKSRATVANTIRLLDLDKTTRDYIKHGKISIGHAKVLLSIDSPTTRNDLLRRTLADGITVRQLEQLATPQSTQRPQRPSAPIKPPHIKELERKLRQYLGTKVSIQQGEKRGRIVIDFYSVQDFDRIADTIGLTRSH